MATNDIQPSGTVLCSLFEYKAWANKELFSALGTIDAVAHPVETHGAIRILNHVYVVDRIFVGHLVGVPHDYEATNTKETPALSELAAKVREVDAWYVSYVGRLSGHSMNERVRFTFTDGDAGEMSREEILMHVITHGGYHRGAAGQVMKAAASAPPRDLYTRFLHASQPDRRGPQKSAV